MVKIRKSIFKLRYILTMAGVAMLLFGFLRIAMQLEHVVSLESHQNILQKSLLRQADQLEMMNMKFGRLVQNDLHAEYERSLSLPVQDIEFSLEKKFFSIFGVDAAYVYVENIGFIYQHDVHQDASIIDKVAKIAAAITQTPATELDDNSLRNGFFQGKEQVSLFSVQRWHSPYIGNLQIVVLLVQCLDQAELTHIAGDSTMRLIPYARQVNTDWQDHMLPYFNQPHILPTAAGLAIKGIEQKRIAAIDLAGERHHSSRAFMELVIVGIAVLGGIVLILLAYAIFLDCSRRKLKTAQAKMEQDFLRVDGQRAHMDAVFNGTSEGILTINRESDICSINEACAAMFGYRPEDLLGKKLDHLLPKDDRHYHRGIVSHSTLKNPRVINQTRELFGLHRAGYDVPIELTVSSIMQGDEQLFVGILRDLTERKKAQRRIAEGEARFRALAEHLPHGLCVHDNGRPLFINTMFANFAGHSSLLSDEGLSMIKESLSADDQKTLDMVLSGDVPEDIPQQICIAPQSKFPKWFTIQCFSLNWESKKAAGLIVADITAEKMIEKRLLEQEHHLRQIIDTAVEGFVQVDADERVAYVNKSLCAMLEQPPEKLIGRNVRDIVHPVAHLEIDQQLAQRSHVKHRIYEVLLTNQSGMTIPTQFNATSLFSPSGKISSSFAFVSDLTKQKKVLEHLQQAREEADRANALKGDFLANMSHEIRTPMNAIIGLLHLLQSSDMDVRQQGYIRQIQCSADSLLGIINDILDLSKIEAGEMSVENVLFELEDVITNVYAINNQAAVKKGVHLVFNVAPTIPSHYQGDPLRLGQVLNNLISNAIKFTDTGTVKIDVACTQQSPDVDVLYFRVTDTGIGMTTQQQANLFKPFSQADSSITRKFGGTGLGLSISQHLVAKMGGDSIAVESVYGQGSCFSFAIKVGHLPDCQSFAGTPSPLLDGMPVVIWIDNADKRQAISQYVRAFGAMPIVLENDQDISSWLQQFQLYEGTIAVLTHYQSKHGAILQQMRDNPFIPALYVIGLEKEGVDYLEHAISANTGQDFHAAYDIVLDEAFHMSAVKKALELANPDPFHDDVNWQKVAEKKSQLPAVLCGVHILIVEDNSLNQMIARELLGSFGATCDVVNDGAAACAAVLEDGVSYDLILMDVQMPVMDGYTATAHIRRRIASSDLPIIGLTAHAMSEHERLAEKAGMDGYVAKPIDPRALLGTICRLLGRDPADQSTDGHSKARSAAPQAAALGDTDTHDGQAVNYEMAIGRMLGRRDLYLDVVRKFLKDSASYMQQMWAGWRDHDHDAVIHTVHTLKGLYGTLGAKKAAHYAKQLECAVKSAHAEKAATLIKRLSELHQDVEDELGVLLADQQDDQRITENVCDSNVIEPPAEALSAEVRACIATLTILLAEYDGETIDYVKNNQKYLIAAIGKRQFTDMLDALQGYDFETAQQILQPFVDAGKPAQ